MALIISLSYAQNPVPNPSFETWSNNRPTGWEGSTDVVQSSHPHTGAYAAEGLVSNSSLNPDLSVGQGNGSPVSVRYTYLNYYYMYAPQGHDQMLVQVYMDDGGGNTLGGGQLIVTSAKSQYTAANIPISYSLSGTVASCTIDFYITDSVGDFFNLNLGSNFTVDDVSLSMSPISGINDPVQAVLDFTIMPNPAKNWINIQTNGDANGTLIRICNILGQSENMQFIESPVTQINVSELPAGIYFAVLSNGELTETKKIEIVR